MKVIVPWHVTSSSLVDMYRHFGGMWNILLLSWWLITQPTVRQHVAPKRRYTYLPHYTASHTHTHTHTQDSNFHTDSHQTLKSRTNCMLSVFDTAFNTSVVQKYDTFPIVDWAPEVRYDVQNRKVFTQNLRWYFNWSTNTVYFPWEKYPGCAAPVFSHEGVKNRG